MFLAWAIIFAHSIIPHHHHSDNVFSACTQCHLHENTLNNDSHIWDHDKNSKDHICHFKVETFTQVSIDNIFIVNTDNSFLNSISVNITDKVDYYLEFVSEQIPKTNFLRGPPATLSS